MFKLVQKARKNQKGFTLVELMVVVVIIGVLVAIAVPVYNGVQEAAATNAADATIRTLNGAVAVYSADNDGAFPATADVLWTGTNRYIQSAPEFRGNFGYNYEAATGLFTRTGTYN